MSQKLTFLKLAEKILKEEEKPLTVYEIWDLAKKQRLDEEIGSIGKTPWRSIGAQIYTNIRDNDDSIFAQYSQRPARFVLKEYVNKKFDFPEEIETEQEIEQTKNFHERDLHQLLVNFANSDLHFKAYLKTIFHENSIKKKSGYNEWLHPDLVGVYFPFEKDLDENALDLQKTLSLSSTRLFSFEMKIKLNWANLRQSYFQAVSNSSWAHEGYLVALEIEEGDDFHDELRRLNNAFGIGIIKLNPTQVDQSEVILPSKEKKSLDWDTINRLIKSNEDFRSFIQRVTNDSTSKEIRKEKYDPILLNEKLTDYVINKKIS
jgi:uncharacterized protein